MNICDNFKYVAIILDTLENQCCARYPKFMCIIPCILLKKGKQEARSVVEDVNLEP